MSRYPYTDACDYIRYHTAMTADGCTLSRSDASRIMEGIAAALDMPNIELAERLADAYANLGERNFSHKAHEFMRALGRL